jgi:uncharacterized protein involved in exopolysaccharide biosynthesis
MELEVFWKNIKKRRHTVVGIILISFILVGTATFLQPLKYSVKSRLLISQNISGADPYTVSKSNQYLSNLFSQVVYSSSFFNLTTSAGFNIDTSYFGNDYKTQMKVWKKTIEARSVGDTGIMEIYIYHPNTYQAQQIALAVNQTLISKSFNYQQGGDQVIISVIDQPLTSSFPIKPNLILNFAAALILGIAATSLWIYFFPIKEHKHQPKKQNNLVYQEIPTENYSTYPAAPSNLPTEDTKADNYYEPRGNINNILK